MEVQQNWLIDEEFDDCTEVIKLTPIVIYHG